MKAGIGEEGALPALYSTCDVPVQYRYSSTVPAFQYSTGTPVQYRHSSTATGAMDNIYCNDPSEAVLQLVKS